MSGMEDSLMFERYTDRARRVIVLAQQAARDLNHNWIGTEHLAIGLIGEGEGVAGQALIALGVTEAAVREAVVARIGIGQHEPCGHIPFTPRLKKACELALRESLQLGCNYIGTEYLLLGMLREGDGTGVRALEECGPTLGDMRAKVLELLRGYAEQEKAKPRPALSSLPWRTGRKNPRTIYVILGDRPSDDDPFIGTLDTAELVTEAVYAHNAFRAGDRLVRAILEALSERDGLPLESSATRGEPARNDELALRLRIGQVFGLENDSR